MKTPETVKEVVTCLLDRFFATIKHDIEFINANDHLDIVRGTVEVTRNKKYITLCCDDKTKKPRKPREKKDVVTAWDLKNHKWVTIPEDKIIEVDFLDFSKHIAEPCHEACPFDLLSTPSIEEHFNENKYIDTSIKRLKDTDSSNIECYDLRFDSILQAVGMTAEEFLKITPHEEEEFLKVVRLMWMDKIRIYRNQSLVELDELEEETKKASDDEADLEDVNVIKQMFRDIPQEIDLDEFKEVEELLAFWPSLLLPHPGIDVVLKKE